MLFLLEQAVVICFLHSELLASVQMQQVIHLSSTAVAAADEDDANEEQISFDISKWQQQQIEKRQSAVE